MNSLGRWEISLGRGYADPELSIGSRVFLFVAKRPQQPGAKFVRKSDADWRLTRIEYDHAAQRYVSVDGYRLVDGIMAALPTGRRQP
jgi:hypothetical protein